MVDHDHDFMVEDDFLISAKQKKKCMKEFQGQLDYPV